jgi:hypothetical protein
MHGYGSVLQEAVQVMLEIGIPLGVDRFTVGGVVGVQAFLLFPFVGHAVVVGIARGGERLEVWPSANFGRGVDQLAGAVADVGEYPLVD